MASSKQIKAWIVLNNKKKDVIGKKIKKFENDLKKAVAKEKAAPKKKAAAKKPAKKGRK